MRDQAVVRHPRAKKRSERPESASKSRQRPRVTFRWLPRTLSLLTYLVVLLSTAWLLYYSVESPYFQVHEISVSGTRLLDSAQVQDTSGVLGSNAILIQREAIEQSVLKITAVRDASAEVSLAGTVTIDVTERTPVVQWQAHEGAFLVDGEGVAFGQQEPPSPLLVVRDIDGPGMEVGTRLDPSIIASLRILDAGLGAKAGIKPSMYDYSRSNGLSVQVPDGPRVFFGDAEDLDAKLSALASITDHLASIKSRAESIDLRFRGHPTYVLAPAAPAKQGQTR